MKRGQLLNLTSSRWRLSLNEQGHVCGIRFLRTRLGEPDARGRRRPVPVEGSEFGHASRCGDYGVWLNPHGMPWLESHGVTVDKWGRIIADVESQYRYQTTNRKSSPVVTPCVVRIWWLPQWQKDVMRHRIIDWLGVKSVKSH